MAPDPTDWDRNVTVRSNAKSNANINQSDPVMSTLARIEKMMEEQACKLEKIDPMYKLCQELAGKQSATEIKVSDLQQENEQLKCRLMAIEQRTRINNIEITGFPQTQNEDVKLIITTISQKIGYPIEKTDIMACHRVPTRVSGNPPNIVAELRNRPQRSALISSYKKHIKTNGTITGDSIHPTLGDAKIFIYEHLTPEMKDFRRVVKNWANHNGFKYVWIDEGTIKVRKDKEKPIVIKSTADLAKLGSAPPSSPLTSATASSPLLVDANA